MELWCCLKRRWPTMLRGHLFVVHRFEDARILSVRHLELFEYIIFKFTPDTSIDTLNYTMKIFKCADTMNDIRNHIKITYKTSYLGHTYTINKSVPPYAFLKEWYVQDAFSVYILGHETLMIEPPHVVVFDLDSTLITDELEVSIRDEFVYESLDELRDRGCVLILWSYGSEDHVSDSMRKTRLDCGYFHKIICGGYKTTTTTTKPGHRIDRDNSKIAYRDRQFFLDVTPSNGRLPKSPRIVLYYLQRLGVNCVKTITLVDDLKSNNYSYDNFVNVSKSPVPRNDWQKYHDQIVDYMKEYDEIFK
ncbi:hypothetical protein 38K [Spodoptera litura nucleopolyhedrovirus]|uniref:38K n=1 Tax=Spodoptera litura multicapsid nucleopolyhedrovirus TaxID=46242 RepID=Q91BD9_NPVST|nr:hypothetical protein 38K [Spodoptera litura nucleopolyhedrovirus]AAL01770.1 hypothetical protein 38K [Spodoptera litura nucleopolyhedrovirus]